MEALMESELKQSYFHSQKNRLKMSAILYRPRCIDNPNDEHNYSISITQSGA